MGDPMVRRLLAAGHAVTVWNRTSAKAEALAGAGARAMSSLQDAVRGAHIVISMLEAGPTVQEVLRAALPALAPGTLWLDMSSTQQAEAQAFHAQLTAQGGRFIDAPVSGGVGGAAAGTLAIMAGGAAEDFAEAEPVLAAMGRATLVGPAGAGQVAKLCNQLIVGATINIVAEAMLLAQAAGADPAAMRAAIRGGFAESKILDVHGQRMLERNFVAGGKVSTQLKDQRNILAAAQAAGIVLPLTELVTARYMTLSKTIPQADHSAALIGLEQLNPGQRVGDSPDKLS
ncbi:NAD-binding protein [Duganella sp. FT109W]|uniref:NAD-binding protein n=2 Tax=Duganella margarita TaxID=2692170 RepID=A0ABW9WF14_9BURK|nr:NAD-binding protein [Duganella margarita]